MAAVALKSAAFEGLEIQDRGHLTYRNEEGWNCSANLSLTVIRLAWDAGCSFEGEADGFGAGLGTCGGDWSGIRDSSDAAEAIMLAKALAFLGRAAKVGVRAVGGR